MGSSITVALYSRRSSSVTMPPGKEKEIIDVGLCDLWWEEEVMLHRHASEQGQEGTQTNMKNCKVKGAKMGAQEMYLFFDKSS